MIAEIGLGLSSIKTALDILRGAKDLKGGAPVAVDIHGLQTALIDAQRGLIAANEAHAAHIEVERALKEEVRELKDNRTELARYELKDLGWGAFAYMLKKDARAAEPPHWVCANCFKKGQISIVQYMWKKDGTGPQQYTCPNCWTVINPSNHSIEWVG